MKRRSSLKKNKKDNALASGAPSLVNRGLSGVTIQERGRAAFLWDESFLWGIMAFNALKKAGLPFDLISSEDIRNGCLNGYATLFVPGGWSSNKMKALGDQGVEAIRRFVHGGGNYLGFCGGAGLATLDGIGLLDIKRKPTKDRVPSFSGRIRLKTKIHRIWTEAEGRIFHAWWPPQFGAYKDNIRVLATYDKAMPDSFSSDLCVGDIKSDAGWAGIEKAYSINLDPSRIYGEPAVIEGRYGEGTVVLSLVHFDTPGDTDAGIVLRNLWRLLSGVDVSATSSEDNAPASSFPLFSEEGSRGSSTAILNALDRSVDDLISFGMRNFLWFWRNPMLLQWRRGVRGLEYNTLYVMIRTVTSHCRASGMPDVTIPALKRIKKRLLPFISSAKELLLRERLAMQQGRVTFEDVEDADIRSMRLELFSSSKSYGGLFKEILDEIDSLLFELLRKERSC